MASFVGRSIAARDGLRLHVRDYGLANAAAAPVVCLPGLARTAADFEAVAEALLAAPSGDGRPRRVLVPDYRGRGLSDRDPDPDHYELPVESDDIQTVLAALDVGPAVFVGTSRGGLHTMMLAALRPAMLRGVVLNDIGPVIEPRGLARIRGYVGKLPQPRSWSDAVDLLKQVAGAQFSGLEPADWDAYARTTFEDRDGTFVPRYDPALMRGLEKLDLEAVPTLWPQFEALGHVPVLVVRGANSDLLSPETLAAMTARLPDCTSLTVPGQGHAPLLRDAATIDRIVAFAARCEARARDARTAERGLAMLS